MPRRTPEIDYYTQQEVDKMLADKYILPETFGNFIFGQGCPIIDGELCYFKWDVDRFFSYIKPSLKSLYYYGQLYPGFYYVKHKDMEEPTIEFLALPNPLFIDEEMNSIVTIYGPVPSYFEYKKLQGDSLVI